MKANDTERLVRANIRALCPYSTARDEYQGSIGVFLDANESPYDTGWNRYPDPRQRALKEKISAIKGVPAGNIFLGNGSDEAIDLVYRIFCEPGRDNAVMIAPSYGMYKVAADINDVQARQVQLGEDFSLDREALLKECDSRTKLLFICSPNNPSANAFPREQLLDIAERFQGMLVVDEAYADFSSQGSLLGSLAEHPNLIILQTFSKAWGMAGLRLGMAFASEYVIRLMSMVKYPYNISQAVQEIALEALSNPGNKAKELVALRDKAAEGMKRFAFIRRIYPSDANFLLVKVDDAPALYKHLLADGIIVRNRSSVRGCEGCLRITTGLEEENKALSASLEEYEKGNIHR